MLQELICIQNISVDSNFIIELIKWITPVLLFIAAYIVNKWIKRGNRRKQLKKIKNYFITILKALVKQNSAQIKQNIDCITRLKNYQTNNIKINKVASNSLKRISDIGFDDLFEIFVLNGKKNLSKDESHKIFYDLNNNIDFIEASIPSLFESNIETISNLTQIGNKWNLTFQNIVDFRNKVALDYNRNMMPETTDKFADGFINAYDQYISMPKSEVDNFNNAHQKLIIPLINHARLFHVDPRANILLQFCTTMNILHESILDQRYQHRKFLILSTRGIIKTNSELKKFLKTL